jgi:Fe-S cluster biogenesis protein NfuA
MLLEVEARRDTGNGQQLLEDGVTVAVVGFDRAGSLPVRECGTCLSSGSLQRCTDQNVESDLLIGGAHFVALVHSAVYVDVPNSASVNQHMALKVLGRESPRNRA